MLLGIPYESGLANPPLLTFLGIDGTQWRGLENIFLAPPGFETNAFSGHN